MTNELVKSQLSKTLKAKSLNDLVRVRTSEVAVLLLDVSGSMKDHMRNGKSKHSGLREVVLDIQKKRPTKMIAFGGSDGGAYVVTSIPAAGGGTPLHNAIDLAKSQGCGRCIVVSDGCPDSPPAAMEAARNFGGQIDVIFVGNPGEYGEEFLKQLAEATGGTEFHGDLSEPKELGAAIMGLLTDGSDEVD